MLKQEVISEMRVLPHIDPEQEIQRRTQFIKHRFYST